MRHLRTRATSAASVSVALVLLAVAVSPTPAVADPNISVIGLVSLESNVEVTTSGQTTQHPLSHIGTPSGDGVLRLEVDGDYGSSSETALLFIEGDFVGSVGNTGSDCIPDSDVFSIPLSFLATYALDDLFELSVENTADVDVFCLTNFHAVTLTFPSDVEMVDFGQVALGSSGGAEIAIRNTGDSLLTVQSITTNMPEFAAVPNSGTVPPEEWLTVTLTFTPSATGLFEGTLDVVSDDPDQPLITVDLIGTGFVFPDIQVHPNPIEVSVPEGANTTSAVLTIDNNGPGDLDFSIASSMPWLSTNPASGTVVPSGTLDVDVLFDATGQSVGLHPGLLGIESNDPDTPILYVNVEMTVTPAPDIVVDPTQLDFGTVEVGGSPTMAVAVHNVGGATLHITSVASNAPEFVPSLGIAIVVPGGQSNINVTFTPPQTGIFGGTLRISSDDPDQPVVTVPMTGQGVPPPVIGLIPEFFDVTVEAGTVSIENLLVTNTGPGTLDFNISNIPSWLEISPTAGSVSSASSANVTATFDAVGLSAGIFEVPLIVDSNDPIDPRIVVPVTMTVVSLPDINVGRSITLTSVEDYGTSGATTQHQFSVPNPPNEGGALELVADGNFGGPTETARLEAEGVTLGSVGTSGAGCGPVSDTFPIYDLFMASLAADGIVEATVSNSNDVGAHCPINRHTLRLRYIEEISGLSFGNVPVGTTVELTVDVENSGALPLQVGPLTTDSPEFTVAPVSFTVDPGATVPVTVTFGPTSIDLFTGTLDIPSNDPDEPLVTLPLTGNGAQPGTIDISPPSLASTLHSGDQESQTLTVSNTGAASLEFSISAAWTSVPVTPTETFLNFEPYRGTVAPAASVDVEVYFSTIGLPTGVHEAEISFSSSDPFNPLVTLPASLTVTSAPHIQVAGDWVQLESSVDYSTAGAVTAHELAGAGPPVGAGLVVLRAEGNFVTPGRTATLSADGVEFGSVGDLATDCRPTSAGFGVEVGRLTGMDGNGIFSFEAANTLEVEPGCPTNRHTVTLFYWPEVTTLGFGIVGLGEQKTLPLRIENNGTELLDVSSIGTDTPEFTVSISSASLQPGESAALDVTLSPLTEDHFTGVLEIVSDDPDSPLIQISLAGGGECLDDDGDGVTTCDGDCDDTNPYCGLNCTNQDGDYFCAPFDCDDLVPTCGLDCTDADSDGTRVCDGDCDDANPFCAGDCADVDADGVCVPLDCDDANPFCDFDCTDVDSDGYCITSDCDDSIASCTEDCSDFDSDGLRACAGDCDDTNANCTTDCTDTDSDGYCVTTDCLDLNPNCTTDCTDADADGYCVTTDCDETNANCTYDCTDLDDDGFCVTTDCDEFNPNCTDDCTDADADGFCATVDCDETNAHCTDDCTDADGDGYCVTHDCDETNANCTYDCTDADDDGYCVTHDCDETNASCTDDCTDVDGDGYCATGDCDDSNANCTTDCADADEDGYCVTVDCDDSSFDCTDNCDDADSDGLRICDGDCDDENPFCSTDCTDADADGYCVTDDCDDSSPHCTTDCTDLDGDGFCLTEDCDETNPDCTDDCDDADMDGVRICDGDCVDDDADSYPGATELCTDSHDNDCDGLSDEQDEPCDGLLTANLRFPTGDTMSISWDAATTADWYGLYRGAIPESGFIPYMHLCEAAQVSGTSTQDPDTPPPGQGFYYLVTGQLVDAGDGDRWVGGPLGRTSFAMSRPDSSTISCGPRVYVDPDQAVEDQDGLSWATAYTGVRAAIRHPDARERGVEVWTRGDLLDGAGVIAPSTRAGVRLLGGFSGAESASWERDTGAHPTMWRSPSNAELIRVLGVSLVLDGLTMRGTGIGVNGVIGSPAGALTELIDLNFNQMTGWPVDLVTASATRLVVEGCDFDSAGMGAVRAVAEAGSLSGRVRGNSFAGGSDAVLRLEARPVNASSAVELDVLTNVISGGNSGMVLGAHLDDRPLQALQSSFVASNLVFGTSGSPVVVEAGGNFVVTTEAAAAVAEPLVIGNTLSDGGAAGIVVEATRDDFTGSEPDHIVRASPQIWDNLITFNAGAGIEESVDDEATGLTADPAAVIGNDLYGNSTLYLDEGATGLILPEEVNALPGAADNFDEVPGYVDRPGGDYHLSLGTVLGFGSTMRHLVNLTDPGLPGLGWAMPLFDDSGWERGAYGVGYDTEPPPNAEALLETIVPTGAYSVFTRTTFTVDDVSQISGLKFGADYDDGCVAWINGVEVFRSTSMPGGDPDWDTEAAPHESSNGATPQYEIHDVSPASLVNGVNVLAVGVWNEALPSTDLVLVPLLILNEEIATVDAGHNDAPRMAREDLDGESRAADGDHDGLSRPDVGADERQ